MTFPECFFFGILIEVMTWDSEGATAPGQGKGGVPRPPSSPVGQFPEGWGSRVATASGGFPKDLLNIK